jgi:alkanesulfonate monooxygenase SsuD/methylene tetrahydromethanopterin reductase-like flavin-dependent oxidoreductase (luciferase family)
MASDALPRFGVSISSTHHHDAPTRMIERAQAAHRAGFASLSIGDHHDMGVPYAQNTPMLGRLLSEWPDRPAGCLFLVPLWSPLLMAEQIGTLAAIHHASAPGVAFIVQTGIGWGASQFGNFGKDMSRRGRDIDAAIPVVKALLAGEVVTDDYFGLHEAKVGLRSDGPYEWWIGGTVEAAMRRAVRLGDVWYGAPGQDDESIRVAIDRYRSAGGERVAVRRDALLLRDGDAARGAAADLIAKGYRGMALDALLAGDAESVGERCAELRAIGCDDIIVRCASPDQAVALETLEQFAGLTTTAR